MVLDHFHCSKLIAKIVVLSVCTGLIILLASQPAFAQTSTTYTYDAQGRITRSDLSNGAWETIDYDDANNITNATGHAAGAANNPPVCSAVITDTNQSNPIVNGLLDCSDPDGDTLTLVSVTDPPGAATAQVYSSTQILFGNLNCNMYTVQRTVSDGNGGTVTSDYSIIHIGFGCF